MEVFVRSPLRDIEVETAFKGCNFKLAISSFEPFFTVAGSVTEEFRFFIVETSSSLRSGNKSS